MSNQQSARPYRFALVLGIGSPFYKTIARGVLAEAEIRKIEVRVEAPEDFRADLQIPIINAAVAAGVDAIIITPCDAMALIEPLRYAYEAGIKIITVDAFLGDGNYIDGQVTFPQTFIGSDNIKGGRMGAEALFPLINGRGKIYIQSTQVGVSATDLREQGFQDALAKSGTAIELVGIGYDGGSIARAAEQTASVLERTLDLAGIFSTGDYSTRGVVQALKQAKRQGVKVVRFDASEQAVVDLLDGTIDVIIGQLPAEMGRLAVRYARQAVQGGRDIPAYVPTDLVLINRENLATPQAQEAICRV